MTIPYVLEQSPTGGERSYDLASRLLKDRIIFLADEINDTTAYLVTMQLLFLDKQSDLPIELYINSPGGSVVDGLAIYDVMHIIRAPVNTTCIGSAASMGAVLLAGGTGTRSALPNSRIMIHQVSSGFRGTAADMAVQFNETTKLYDKLLDILAKHTKQDREKIKKDCERDYYMSSQDAKEYGLVDEVVEPLPPHQYKTF